MKNPTPVSCTRTALFFVLFFLNIYLISAQTAVSGEAGTLFVDDEGSSGYFLSGVSLRPAPQKNGATLWADFNVLQMGSTLAVAEGAPFAFSGRVGIDTANFGLDFEFGGFQHAAFSSDVSDFSVDSEGGTGTYLGLRIPLRFYGFTLEPAAYWGSGAWEDGSFYWFLGKPELTDAGLFGISLSYMNHSASFYYAVLGLDIMSNDELRLFTANAEGFFGFYTFSFERRFVKLAVSAGLAHADGSFNGELTDSNQHYWLFPYIFYQVDGEFYINAGALAVDLRFYPTKARHFNIEASAAAAYVSSSRVHWTIRYKNKNLFGGKSGAGRRGMIRYGIPGIFLRVGVGWDVLPIGKTSLSFGLRKIFIIAGDYESQDLAMSSIAAPSTDLIKTALLSGLSFYAELRF